MSIKKPNGHAILNQPLPEAPPEIEAARAFTRAQLQETDPRGVLNALLVAAAELSIIIIRSRGYSPSQVASVFGGALAQAMPSELQAEESRILRPS